MPKLMKSMRTCFALACAAVLSCSALRVDVLPRRLVLGGGAALALPWPALADQSRRGRFGEAAKTGGFDDIDAVTRNSLGSDGPASYEPAFSAMDEAERAAVLAKIEAVGTRWRRMSADVGKALSASTPAYPVAQSALDNNMNAVKGEMRTVAKALSGGDITVRDDTMGGVDQPQFDYNKGSFKLQPLAEQAEQVFDVINGLYFDGIKRKAPPDSILASMDEASGRFDAWLGAAKGAAQKARQ